MAPILILQLAHDSNIDRTKVDYLPWGTRSLKLRLKGDYTGTIFLHPEIAHPDEDYIAGLAAPADEEGRIELSWGGGYEQGFRIDGFANWAYAFFNIRHFGPDTSRCYSVTIIASTESGEELARLEVGLTPPDHNKRGILLPRWETPKDGPIELVLQPSSTEAPISIPRYQSRWWPSPWVEYIDPAYSTIGPPPLITLSCQRNTGHGYSEIAVMAQASTAENPVELAMIDGDIQFPLIDLQYLSAELFYQERHWWLRIWFWWLDKGVASRLADHLNPDEETALRGWPEDQEIPDAERIDLVLNNELHPVFVATDFHWHEMWASCAGALPLHASIAGTNPLEVVVRGTKGLNVVVAGQARYHLDPPAKDPLKLVIKRLRDPNRQQTGPGSKLHKHTPYFHEVEFEDDLVSSDVRRG